MTTEPEAKQPDSPDISAWQGIIDGCHDLWEHNQDWRPDDVMANVTPGEREAFALGKLYQQVRNGGFAQWHCNGYSSETMVSAITSALVAIDTEPSRAVLAIVKAFLSQINKAKRAGRDPDDLEFDELDTKFYEIDDRLAADVEEYFLETFPGLVEPVEGDITPVMTARQIKDARRELGLNRIQFARVLGYAGKNAASQVHHLEIGRRDVREPQRLLVEAYLNGYRPPCWGENALPE